MPFLGGLPLDIRIREQADSGRPTVVADPDGKVAEIYRAIARKVAISVAQKAAAPPPGFRTSSSRTRSTPVNVPSSAGWRRAKCAAQPGVPGDQRQATREHR